MHNYSLPAVQETTTSTLRPFRHLPVVGQIRTEKSGTEPNISSSRVTTRPGATRNRCPGTNRIAHEIFRRLRSVDRFRCRSELAPCLFRRKRHTARQPYQNRRKLSTEPSPPGQPPILLDCRELGAWQADAIRGPIPSGRSFWSSKSAARVRNTSGQVSLFNEHALMPGRRPLPRLLLLDFRRWP